MGSLSTLLMWMVTAQAPAGEGGVFIKPAQSAEAVTLESAAPAAKATPERAQPPPDRDDARDAPETWVVAPSVDGSVMAWEQDAPTLLGQAVGTAFPMALCGALPGVGLTGLMGSVTLLVALLLPAVWPLAVLVPVVMLGCGGPAWCGAGTCFGTLGTLVAQAFSGQRGPLVQPALAALATWLVLGVLGAVPVVVASVALAVAGWTVLPVGRAHNASALQGGVARGFVVAAVAHPVLAALWMAWVGVTAAAASGAVAAVVFKALGRHRTPGEGYTLDWVDVDGAPAAAAE